MLRPYNIKASFSRKYGARSLERLRLLSDRALPKTLRLDHRREAADIDFRHVPAIAARCQLKVRCEHKPVRLARFELLVEPKNHGSARRVGSRVAFIFPEPMVLKDQLHITNHVRRFIDDHS